MPAARQGRMRKLLRSIQNLLGLNVCIKRRSSEVKESDEKLLNIFNELTVGISEVFEDKPQAFDEYLRCDKVSCKISALSEQIGQVRILYSLWKNGYDLNPQELMAKLQSLNLLVDCIRDDVFYAYLRLPPEQKLRILKKDKQVSAIFAVLGTLENEVSEMMKTTFPNGELAKAIGPLLKPNFNRVLYKRQAKNFYNYDPPAFQTVQFSCKKVACRKPKLVDACTDPIRDLVRYDGLREIGDQIKLPIKDLEPVHRAHQTDDPTRKENAACQAAFPDEIHDGFSDSESAVILTKPESERSVFNDRLWILTANDPTRNDLHEPHSVSCSQECFREESPQKELSFWKLAADLIADQPVRS